MDKPISKFDVTWKIALIIILIGGMIYLGTSFKNINTDGLDCLKTKDKWQKEFEDINSQIQKPLQSSFLIPEDLIPSYEDIAE